MMLDLLRLYGDRRRSHGDRDATARIHTNACTEPGGAAAASGVFPHGKADGIVRHVASLLVRKVDFYQILPFCVGISTFLRGLGGRKRELISIVTRGRSEQLRRGREEEETV